MVMTLIEVSDPKTWDDSLLRLPHPHILQTWEWGEFKSRYGWSPRHLLWLAGNQPQAAALVLQRKARWLPGVMYVPKGPVLDWSDAELVIHVLNHLEHIARHSKAIFIKIDPDVADDADGLGCAPGLGTEIKKVMNHRGWRFSSEQIQFRNTLCLDLTRSEESLLAAMKPKTRYNIRLAARRGVTVRHGTLADLPDFYDMYAETGQRDGFIVRPPAYYHDAWGQFLEAGRAQMLLAEHEGQLLAGLILFTFGATAWYMYGASIGQRRDVMPNHLLQWEAIRLAQRQGCTVYDMWGAPDVLDESDRLWGVYRFKAGFGAQFVRRIGAWDFPVNRVIYALYMMLMPRYLAWQRRRHQIQLT